MLLSVAYRKVRESPGLLRFILFVALTCLVLFVNNSLLVTNEMVYSFYNEKMSNERIAKMLAARQEWKWFIYVTIPIFFFLKFTLISLTLNVGTLLLGWKLDYSKIWNSVVLAEFVFLSVPIIKLSWFYFLQADYSLFDLQSFHPFSVLNFFKITDIDPWWIYPLQLLSVFELVYWLLLAHLLGQVAEKPLKNSLTLVASSYGIALVLFATFVVFLNVTFTD